jgi:hypothetical protein
MAGEDSHDALLRRLREHQDALIARISRGNTPADNTSGGYLHVTGQVVGLDVAIGLVREILFGDRPQEPEKSLIDRYL